MKRGFTLVELLAIIVLLGLLLMLVYPKVLGIAEEKQLEISEAKEELIHNAVEDYMSANLNDYPQTLGSEYCLSLETLDNENLIPTDISKILKQYKYIKVRIGLSNNSYVLYDTEENCKN